jgi:hypothetical protein
MLGIEGVVHFVESRDAGGTLVLDSLVPIEGGVVPAPAGQQSISAYNRACDANCGLLDPPSRWLQPE